ncbi:MAG: SprT-like family protein [Lachnospiraceae bacterium]|nr:SprT-like family protein [Lachnospiraceae bacterium]
MIKNMQEMLEHAYDIFNAELFNCVLPPVAITIMSSPRSNAHFTLDKVWRNSDVRVHEINISAEHLDRSVYEVLASLIHEMVHYYCLLNDLKDTSQNHRYHNKVFKQEAEKRGLSISYAKYIGYSVTEPTQQLMNLIDEYGLHKPIDINRDGAFVDIAVGIGGATGIDGIDGLMGIDGTVGKKKKTSTRKYICSGGCGCSFRATKDLKVMCLDCMAEYIRADGTNGNR